MLCQQTITRHSVPESDEDAYSIVSLWIERLPRTKEKHQELLHAYRKYREKFSVLDAWLLTLKEFS